MELLAPVVCIISTAVISDKFRRPKNSNTRTSGYINLPTYFKNYKIPNSMRNEKKIITKAVTLLEDERVKIADNELEAEKKIGKKFIRKQ